MVRSVRFHAIAPRRERARAQLRAQAVEERFCAMPMSGPPANVIARTYPCLLLLSLLPNRQLFLLQHKAHGNNSGQLSLPRAGISQFVS
jgi:hypothetical protein